MSDAPKEAAVDPTIGRRVISVPVIPD